MNNIMIDIETLGTQPGSVLLSISAIRFDIETGQYSDTFYEKISLNDCLKKGLKIDGDTLKWWAKQDKNVFIDQLSGGEKLSKVLGSLSKFITKMDYVWGNSNRFDLGHIEFCYQLLNQSIPWRFSKERDVRTLVSFAPYIKEEMEFKGDKHNPIDDCKHQIRYCYEIWKKLNH